MYSAKRAAIGARTLKSRQCRFFVGYNKHTFRLWISRYERGVLLVPFVSWVAPANLVEGCLLGPSVHHCWRRWQWRPDVVVGDMGYIDADTKRDIRQRWKGAVITRLKEKMKLVTPCVLPGTTAAVVGIRSGGYKALVRGARSAAVVWSLLASDGVCA